VGQIGATALTNATLHATLPAGVTVSAISDGGTQAGSDVTWTLGGLAVGALLHRQVEVTVSAAALPGSILKTRATLTYDGGLALDNVAEYAVPVAAAAPPLTIDVAATPDPAVPGANVLYTVTLGNQAARALENVSVLLRIPGALAFSATQDVEPNGSNCGNFICTADEELTWSFGALAAGATQSFVINAQVQAAAAGDGSLIRASFGATATGVAQLNAIKTVQVFSHPGAQLALGTVVNPITAGQAFTLNADVGQIGTTALAATELRVRLPAGLIAGAISDGGTQAASGDIVWTIGNVAVSGFLHRTVALTASASVVPGAVLVTRASLTHDGGPPVDAQAQHAVYVAAVAEPLTVTVVPTPNPVAPNSRLLYTTTITNTSARAITNIVLIWRLPVGMQFSSTIDTNPDGSNCGNGICATGEEVSWAFPTLAAGASQIITVNSQIMGTLLEGSLISISTRTTGTGLVDPILVDTTVPAHQ
jgi:uncharacterized repeat protein (TIGR01451 family)